MVGSTVYDTGFQVTQGQWSEVAVAWNPDLDLMTVYHVNDGSTMDYKRFTVTNMSCFEDGGVMTVGKWRQPNSNANHPPTEVTYLGEVDEVSHLLLFFVWFLFLPVNRRQNKRKADNRQYILFSNLSSSSSDLDNLEMDTTNDSSSSSGVISPRYNRTG